MQQMKTHSKASLEYQVFVHTGLQDVGAAATHKTAVWRDAAENRDHVTHLL